MRNKYPRKDRKSNHKFEVVRGQEVLVQVPLPMSSTNQVKGAECLHMGLIAAIDL